MKPVTIFRGTSGLNTVADPARIPIGKGHISDVAQIVNMRIDQYYRPSRRLGTTLLKTGDYHSIFCDGGSCFVVSGDSIYIVANNGDTQGIRSGLTPGQKMAWTQYGDLTYYSNGIEQGVIEGGVSKPWVVGEFHGQETNRSFVVPNNINHLEIQSGRIYGSIGKVLWWSEQFRFNLFDLANSFVQFHTKIRMIKAVAEGLFVSTEKNTYFLAGTNPQAFTQRQVASFPAIEWTEAVEYVDGGDVGFDPGLCAVWASPEGAILGFPNGAIFNLNKNKIIYPEASKGFGCLLGYEYLHGII